MRIIIYSTDESVSFSMKRLYSVFKKLHVNLSHIYVEGRTPLISRRLATDEFTDFKIDWDGHLLVSLGSAEHDAKITLDLYSRKTLNSRKEFLLHSHCLKIFNVNEEFDAFIFGSICDAFGAWVGYLGDPEYPEPLAPKYGGVMSGLGRPAVLSFFSNKVASYLNFEFLQGLVKETESGVVLDLSSCEMTFDEVTAHLGEDFFKKRIPKGGGVRKMGLISGFFDLLREGKNSVTDFDAIKKIKI